MNLNQEKYHIKFVVNSKNVINQKKIVKLKSLSKISSNQRKSGMQINLKILTELMFTIIRLIIKKLRNMNKNYIIW